MRVLALGALTASLVSIVACDTYEPPISDYSFHASFTFGDAHTNAGCDACHVEAANLMLQQTPDEPGSPWVTQIVVDPINSCISCHPFIRNGPASPEATVTCDTLPEGDALRTSERCRYELAGAHRGGTTLSCTQGGCHSITHTEWNFTGGGGGPTDEPGPSHDTSPLLDIFPLEGGHQAAACTDCHDLANTANEQGKSESCASAGCHSRTDVGVPDAALHYPAAVGQPETSRDCRACHVNYVVDTYQDYGFTWPTTFSDRQSDHGAGFLLDHGSGVNTCWNCHNAYENDAGSTSLPVYFKFQPSTSRLSCLTCHEVGDGATAISPRIGHGELDQDDCKSCHANGTAAGI